MFNNYKVSLLDHAKMRAFYDELGADQQATLDTIISEMEHLLNCDMQEKEKLLNVVNNLQLSTQNKLDQEMLKNYDLQKQLELLKETIDKQHSEIAFLNRSVQNVYQDQHDLFSPHKQRPSHSPTIQRTQSLNKNRHRRVTEKENENFVCIYSSIKKVKCQDFFIDDNDFKDTCIKQLLDQQFVKETQVYDFCRRLHATYTSKIQELQEVIYDLFSRLDQNNSQYEQVIAAQQSELLQLDQRLFRYRTAFQFLQQEHALSDVQLIIKQMGDINRLISEQDSQQDCLIDILMEFSNTRDQLHKAQQEQVAAEQHALQQKIRELNDQILQLTEQRQELLDLGQQMNEQIIAQTSQIDELQQQNLSLTSLFGKSLQDLETLQEENESLRKSNNYLPTSRTQDGSVQNHFLVNRYSTYLEHKSRQSLSCKNSFKLDSRHFKFDFSSDIKRKQCTEIDELCHLLDDLLSRGFELKTLNIINNYHCTQGPFKLSIMWQKLKEILLNYYYTVCTMDQVFEQVNQFVFEMNLSVEQCHPVSDQGVSYIQDLLEQNEKRITQLLHHMVSDTYRRRCTTEPQIHQELQKLAHTLIDVCASNDNTVVKEIDKQIQLQQQFKKQQNKKLRNLQTGTCRILMEVFKKWKQNYLILSEILLNASKGQASPDSYKALQKSDLGAVISQELHSFLVMIYQQ